MATTPHTDIKWYHNLKNAKEAEGYGGKLFGLWRMMGHPHVLMPQTVVVPWDAKLVGNNLHSLLTNLKALSKYSPEERPTFAVRSSGTSEDGVANSYAGQHLTVLNVPEDEVVQAIRKCRESGMWSQDYSEAVTGVASGMNINVLVQPMVVPRYAGVLFSGNPDTRDRNEMVVEFTDGLADKLVGGEVNPTATIRMSPYGQIKSFDAHMDKASEDIEVLRSYLSTLASGARECEDVLGCPVDIEWALTRNCDVYTLQVRPLTGVVWDDGLNGQGITNGIAEGEVQRLPSDEEFVEGNVLATKMTDPRMVSAMIKSCAIVTETGGRTCHAAIVARELQKPCVVGCSAVRNLKDKDYVYVNANTGRIDVKN